MRISDWSSDVCSSDLQLGHALAEGFGNVGTRQRRVFQRIVQDRRAQGFIIQMQLGENAGDGYRVGDVILATLSGLSAVGICGDGVGTGEDRKCDVSGPSVSVRFDIGGRGIYNKNSKSIDKSRRLYSKSV